MTEQNKTLHTQTDKKDSTALNAAVKKEWNKLTDEDINLYATQKDLFFKKVEEKQQIKPEASRKKMQEIEASCGCSSVKAA